MKKRMLFHFLLAILLFGCRKEFQSTELGQVEARQATYQSFFKLPADASKELKLIALNLSREESRTHFLTSFAKKNGYPFGIK